MLNHKGTNVHPSSTLYKVLTQGRGDTVTDAGKRAAEPLLKAMKQSDANLMAASAAMSIPSPTIKDICELLGVKTAEGAVFAINALKAKADSVSFFERPT